MDINNKHLPVLIILLGFSLVGCGKTFTCGGAITLKLDSSKTEVVSEIKGFKKIYRKSSENEKYISFKDSNGRVWTYDKKNKSFLGCSS